MRVEYEDGIYEGEMEDDQFDGYGSFTYKVRSTFKLKFQVEIPS